MTTTQTSAQTSVEFSHKFNFTGYHKTAMALATSGERGGRALDIPAGAGQISEALREAGFEAVSADINEHDETFVRADMTQRLPFDDGSFDLVMCLEGIEHVLNPHDLFGELFRVCKVGGRVIVSTPNVCMMFSRLQFLLTGTAHQFHFAQLRDLPPGADDDRFHVSPVCFGRLWYEGAYWGGRVERLGDCDRVKRKALMPLYLLIQLFGAPWTRALYGKRGRPEHSERNERMRAFARSYPAMYSRSIVVEFVKQRHVAEDAANV